MICINIPDLQEYRGVLRDYCLAFAAGQCSKCGKAQYAEREIRLCSCKHVHVHVNFQFTFMFPCVNLGLSSNQYSSISSVHCPNVL